MAADQAAEDESEREIAPTAAEAPQMQVSPTRSAGLPPINTVVLPMGNGLAVG